MCIRRCHSVSVLWWETVVLSAACCCWQAPTLCHEENSCFTSMSECEPCPCGSPHLLHFSSSMCAVETDTVHLTLTLSVLSTHKHSNMSPSPLSPFLRPPLPSGPTARVNIELDGSWSRPKTVTLRLLTSKQIEGYAGA